MLTARIECPKDEPHRHHSSRSPQFTVAPDLLTSEMKIIRRITYYLVNLCTSQVLGRYMFSYSEYDERCIDVYVSESALAGSLCVAAFLGCSTLLILIVR